MSEWMFGKKRRVRCPQCGERVIQCRYTGDYCEECGWPESDFDEEGKQMEAERLGNKGNNQFER